MHLIRFENHHRERTLDFGEHVAKGIAEGDAFVDLQREKLGDKVRVRKH